MEGSKYFLPRHSADEVIKRIKAELSKKSSFFSLPDKYALFGTRGKSEAEKAPMGSTNPLKESYRCKRLIETGPAIKNRSDIAKKLGLPFLLTTRMIHTYNNRLYTAVWKISLKLI